jgi:signal transduction histidine kinase
MRLRWARGGTPSLRTRLLAGVMIPSTLVLVVGGIAGVGLVSDAVRQNDLAKATSLETVQSSNFYPGLIAERAASLFFLAQPTPGNRTTLDRARQAVDAKVTALSDTVAQVQELLPSDARADQRLPDLLRTLPDLRARVDARVIPRMDTYRAYDQIADWLVVSNNERADQAPDGASAGRIHRSSDLNRLGDLVDRATALLAGGLLAGDLSRPEYDEFVVVSGAYEQNLAAIEPQLDPTQQAQLAAIQSGAQWKQVSELWDTVIFGGFTEGVATSVPGPLLEQMVGNARGIATKLLLMGSANTELDSQINAAEAQSTLRTSLFTAVLLLVGLIAAFVVALLVTARLVNRLAGLRRDTLKLAETSLPLTVARLRKGERIDLDHELPTLDHGRDEIGQVAAAFNKAQRFAVEAAVEESQTREGFNAAFLNIARRSQAILHQQMQVLDKIERSEPDPDRLEMLFSLDHLATRERRNAENLIILGGEQPRRQWRSPVALGELVRAAVGESEHYQRVTIGSLPHVMVAGAAVGDLVHLLAELVDNATAFSPPAAPIEVHGAVVGRGVVVEVEDQGLGIDDEQLAQLNEMLANPPDFGLFTLSRDSRIGLFVVARLARRHHVRVTLRPSAFGGVRAGLLVPTTALSGDASGSQWQLADAGDTAEQRLPARVAAGVGAGGGRGGRGDSGDGYGLDEPFSPVQLPGRVRGQDGPVLEPTPLHRTGPGRRADPEPAGSGGEDGASDLPRLPRRTRQAHMDARLLAQNGAPEPAPVEQQPDADLFAPPDYSPETARSRMSALRRGAARARMQDNTERFEFGGHAGSQNGSYGGSQNGHQNGAQNGSRNGAEHYGADQYGTDQYGAEQQYGSEQYGAGHYGDDQHGEEGTRW